jgi:hypothetical protein
MSNSTPSSATSFKYIVGTLGLFAVFGFLALVLSGFAGRESIEERAYMGSFSPDIIEARWANREEVDASQAALVDESKMDKALVAVAKSPVASAATDIVVPGSPTFLKQMEEQAATDAKKEAAAADAKKEAAPEPKPDAALAETKKEAAPKPAEAKAPAPAKEEKK